MRVKLTDLLDDLELDPELLPLPEAQLFCIIPDSFIQNFFMNPVRAAITFPVPVVTPADVFHTAAAVPAADHRNECIPTFTAGQQSRIAVLGLIAVCRSCLPLE